MLTEVESAFRSMKTELGLRPVYHQKQDRIVGHLFITVLAFRLVQTLRFPLSWGRSLPAEERTWSIPRRIPSVSAPTLLPPLKSGAGSVATRPDV
jgi:transposase